jgi:hypothetical protein
MELVDILADPESVDTKKWNVTPREPPAVSRPATTTFTDNTGMHYRPTDLSIHFTFDASVVMS